MDEIALIALKASIAHWERLANGTQGPSEKPDGRSCALCKEFLLTTILSPCDGCPVKLATGRDLCLGTPFDAAHFSWRDGDSLTNPQFRACAIVELNFLRSLLP